MSETIRSDVNPTNPVTGRPSLKRLFEPKTVAIVGARDGARFAENTLGTLESDAEVFFVNPRYPQAFGRPTVPNLSAIGKPVDAVLCLTGAELAVEVAEEAADLRAGGLVLIAAAFAEVGVEGAQLQKRLLAAANRGNFPVVGPNGVGYINVPKKLDLTFLNHFGRRPGGCSAIVHSGGVLEAIAASAFRSGGIGLNLMISAGNEAVTDAADFLDYLVEDDTTEIILMALETIRRPGAFFASAKRARDLGKPIIAIKLGRSERSTRMAMSHTGTLTGDAWVYEVALRQANILPAYEIDELVDRAQILDQLPKRKWSPVRGLGVFTGSGGVSSIIADLAGEEGVDVPDVPRLNEWIATVIPGSTVANPLDTTGLASPEVRHEVLAEYENAPEFDALVHLNQLHDWDISAAASDPQRFVEQAMESAKPYIISPFGGYGGKWLDAYREQGVAVGNGVRGVLRGLNTMASFMRSSKESFVAPADTVAAIARPTAVPIQVAEGLMLPFAATMSLLSEAGIPVAPYHLIEPGAPVGEVSFTGPYVVKLADVAHRTEHDAVRVNIESDRLEAAVAELRQIAVSDGLAQLVAVQPMVPGYGEAFIGLQGRTELGPLVVFGLGGILVEILKKVGGRLAPFSDEIAGSLIAEFDDVGVLNGFRGQPAWDRPSLVRHLVAAGQLAAGGRGWIESLDINPLIVTANGYVAVDGLCILAPE